MVIVDSSVPEMVESDEARFRQVLLNLIGNAIEEGAIDISAGLTGAGDGDSKDEILFCIRDTGVGIPSDKLESIFEVCTQADSSTTRRFGGTGLGLAISKK